MVLDGLPGDFARVYITLLRYIAPILAIILVIRCAKPLLSFRREPEIWAWLRLADGNSLPVTHWENVIGRSKRSDIVIALPTISRNHAVLTRYDDGSWTITDAAGKGTVKVNGKNVSICAIQPEDVIDIGGVEMRLDPISPRQEQRLAQLRTKASGGFTTFLNLTLLTLFQVLCCLGYVLNGKQGAGFHVFLGFSGIVIMQWLLFLFYACIKRSGFEVETIAFFLCTMGMNIISATMPQESLKQLIAMVLGMFTFLLIGWSLRDLERAKVVRYIATVAGIGFLVITLLFGQSILGAKNWLIIGGYSIQPSELTKVCFVFAGASTMDRIMQKRNIILFIGYSALLCVLLAIMNDFGTALVFFVAFLSIAYMRSGSLGTVALAITSLGFAGTIAFQIAPHVMRRFSIWRHVWEDPWDRGFQQTRSLMCIGSGGLVGLGAGNGWMKHMFACDTDIVFATISEEWGFMIGLLTVLCIVILALFCLRSASLGRSSFYTIGACTSASILLVQTILNVMGTVDLLPFTGVTFPFLSNGGSSMLSSWALLAFVKAADTRQNASFAIRMNRARGRAS